VIAIAKNALRGAYIPNRKGKECGKGRRRNETSAMPCARGNYFRRKRSEISPDIERNTSTASAPIMQNAIIIQSPTAPNFSLEYASGMPVASVSYLVYLQQVSDWSNGWCAELWSEMWAEEDAASGFPGFGARSASAEGAREKLALQFFDVNGTVARADCERRSTGVQFSAHAGMAQRTGNLNRNIQRDAAVAGVRVERRVQIAR
jgi:hypothetical protein